MVEKTSLKFKSSKNDADILWKDISSYTTCFICGKM